LKGKSSTTQVDRTHEKSSTPTILALPARAQAQTIWGICPPESHGDLLLARLNSLLSNICAIRDQIAYSPDRNRARQRIVDLDLYISRTISRVSQQCSCDERPGHRLPI